MGKLGGVSYCWRVYSYDDYLHDVGELRAMGYTIDDLWNQYVIGGMYLSFVGLYLHITGDCVTLHGHSAGAEVVPNLEYIINELPDLRSK